MLSSTDESRADMFTPYDPGVDDEPQTWPAPAGKTPIVDIYPPSNEGSRKRNGRQRLALAAVAVVAIAGGTIGGAITGGSSRACRCASLVRRAVQHRFGRAVSRRQGGRVGADQLCVAGRRQHQCRNERRPRRRHRLRDQQRWPDRHQRPRRRRRNQDRSRVLRRVDRTGNRARRRPHRRPRGRQGRQDRA